jgi:hypothetical protein
MATTDTDMIIKLDDPEKKTPKPSMKRAIDLPKPTTGQSQSNTDKIIEVMPSAKEVKDKIVKNWRVLTPLQIVKTMRKLYQHVPTLSSQLSNLKGLLTSLPDKPNEDFLS